MRTQLQEQGFLLLSKEYNHPNDIRHITDYIAFRYPAVEFVDLPYCVYMYINDIGKSAVMHLVIRAKFVLEEYVTVYSSAIRNLQHD